MTHWYPVETICPRRWHIIKTTGVAMQLQRWATWIKTTLLISRWLHHTCSEVDGVTWEFQTRYDLSKSGLMSPGLWMATWFGMIVRVTKFLRMISGAHTSVVILTRLHVWPHDGFLTADILWGVNISISWNGKALAQKSCGTGRSHTYSGQSCWCSYMDFKVFNGEVYRCGEVGALKWQRHIHGTRFVSTPISKIQELSRRHVFCYSFTGDRFQSEKDHDKLMRMFIHTAPSFEHLESAHCKPHTPPRLL